MKKLILFIFMFLFIPIVNAATTQVYYNNFKHPAFAYYTNCPSKDNCFVFAGQTTAGGEEVPYWVSPQLTTNASGSGVSLNFFVDEGFIENNYYTLSVLIGSLYSYPKAETSNTTKIVGSGANSTESYNNAIKPIYTSTSDPVEIVSYDNINVFSEQASIVSYTFLAPKNGNYAFINFTTNANTSNNQFYMAGYSLTNQGSKAPTTAEIQSALQSNFNTINNNIGGLNNTIQQGANSVTDSVDNLKDSINNSSTDNPSNKFQEFENMLPENGVITELITLPISLFQNVLNSINGTCTQYNLGNLLGTDLILPCINISNYIGTTLWNVIDILFSGLFVLVIGRKMIKAFNSFTSMEEGDVLD